MQIRPETTQMVVLWSHSREGAVFSVIPVAKYPAEIVVTAEIHFEREAGASASTTIDAYRKQKYAQPETEESSQLSCPI